VPEPIPIKRSEREQKPLFVLTFAANENAVQELFALGIQREEVFSRIMSRVSEIIWESLPMPSSKVPS
jgi:hypothetical protein